MQIIDAHNHFWRYDPVEYAWISEALQLLQKDYLPEQLKTLLNQHGVKESVAVQARQNAQENTFLLELADQHPFITGVVGWLDLCAHDVEEKVSLFAAHPKAKGLRHMIQDEPDDHFMLRKDFKRGIALLKDYDLSYDILIGEKHLPTALRFMEAFPDQRFVLDHMAKPAIRAGKIKAWASHIRELAGHPHLYCKLSGLVTEAEHRHWSQEDFKPYLEVVFDAFGPDRLMYGSDWPVCLLAADYQSVLDLILNYISQFSPQQQEKIMALNTHNFYNL